MPKTAPKIAISVLCAALAATLVACGATSTKVPHASTPGETPSAPVASPTGELSGADSAATPTRNPTQPSGNAVSTRSVTLDSTAWLAGFKVRVTGADFDPASRTVSVRALLTNTSQVDASFDAVAGEIALDPGDDSGLISVQQVRPSTNVVAGTSARTTMAFAASAPITVTTATLVLGKAAHHQWRVPLKAGAAATGESPVRVRSPGRLTTGHAYLDITSAQVVPWSCSGITPYTAFTPSDRSTSVIAIRGSAGALTVPPGGTALEAMSMAAPDGTTASVITPPLKVWSTHQSTPGLLLCLPVPAGLRGTYVLKITDSQRSSASATFMVR